MKGLITFCCTLCIISLSAQNLVRNGGFEPNGCPPTGTTLNEICPPWRDDFTSADHYGPCTFPGSATTNNNIAPHSGDGNIGLYGYGQFDFSPGYNREYVIGELEQRLTAGQLYRVSYWIYPIVVNPVHINAGIDGPGVNFYENLSDFQMGPLSYIDSDSAIYPATPIIERNQWSHICLNFRAVGYERYIALGVFRTDEETNALLLPGANNPLTWGYYLIDDVVVEPIDEPVLTGTEEICPDGEVTLVVPDGLFGTWDDGSTAPERVVTEPGIYTYGYQDGICYRTDAVQVVEVNCTKCAVYYPTAFSPNGDGLNDSWAPKFECTPIEYRLEIFDRAGNLMFRSYHMDTHWEPDNTVEQGTYVARFRMTYELYGDRAFIDKVTEVVLLK